MSAAGVAGATAGVLGGTSGVVAVLFSPWPLLVLGGLAVLIWLPLAVLLLIPVFSRDEARCARATAVLDRLLAAVPGSRAISAPAPPMQLPELGPAPRSPGRSRPTPAPTT